MKTKSNINTSKSKTVKTIHMRPYQDKAIEMVFEAIRKGYKRILLVIPCGGGKTTVAAYIEDKCVKQNKPVLNFVHRKELVKQFAARLYDQFGILSGVVLGNHKRNWNLKVQTGSIQSLSNEEYTPPAKLIIVDEAHRTLGKSYLNYLNRYDEDTITIGLTATPIRGDEQGLGEYYDILIQPVKTRELLGDKWLVPTEVFQLSHVDMSGVSINSKFEYNQKEMLARFDKPEVIRDIINGYKNKAFGKLGIAFNINVAHSKEMCAIFNRNGIPSAHIDGETPEKLRNQIYKDFKKRKYLVLHNDNIFTEGIDVPDIQCVLLNKAYHSFGQYVQAGMRGMRPVWNSDRSDWKKNTDGSYFKEKCLILDAGGNTFRHGFLEDYDDIAFTLEGRVKGKGEKKTKVCKSCDAINPINAKTCFCCEAPFGRSKDDDDQIVLDFGNDVKLEALGREATIIKRLQSIPYHEAKQKVPASQLRIYTLLKIKGNTTGWWWNKAIDFGHAKGVTKSHPQSFQTVRTILMLAETHYETHDLYQKIKKTRKGLDKDIPVAELMNKPYKVAM